MKFILHNNFVVQIIYFLVHDFESNYKMSFLFTKLPLKLRSKAHIFLAVPSFLVFFCTHAIIETSSTCYQLFIICFLMIDVLFSRFCCYDCSYGCCLRKNGWSKLIQKEQDQLSEQRFEASVHDALFFYFDFL